MATGVDNFPFIFTFLNFLLTFFWLNSLFNILSIKWEKINPYLCFQYRNIHLLWISCASWRKNLVIQVKPGREKRLFGGKKMVPWRKKTVIRWKNHVTFFHFTRLAQEN